MFLHTRQGKSIFHFQCSPYMMSLKELQIRFSLFFAPKIHLITSYPATMTVKIDQDEVFIVKIYYISYIYYIYITTQIYTHILLCITAKYSLQLTLLFLNYVAWVRGCSYDPAYTETPCLPRRIFPCVHMEYFVPLAEMKLQCSSIISVCKT
jgi:hypothetical protein